MRLAAEGAVRAVELASISPSWVVAIAVVVWLAVLLWLTRDE